MQKNAIQNNMIQQYLYHGVTIKDTHTHDGQQVTSVSPNKSSHIQWQIFFFNMFIIECFLHSPDETQ